MELTPILAELGYNEPRSFNGLLQVTADGGMPSVGESQKVRGLWYAVAIWVRDAPGFGKILADWITDGRASVDVNRIDYARFHPHQLEEDFIYGRCYESAKKAYNPAVHPREPFETGRNIRRSPFHEREVELGGYFMEIGGWERAHGYAANDHLLAKYGDRVPERSNEWDARHFWRVSNAEHLALSEDCGIVNLSHFSIYEIAGPDRLALLEWLSVARIGGDANVGRGIYTHFLDDQGMVRSDVMVLRMADRCRIMTGADTGPRDLSYLRRTAADRGLKVTITDLSDDWVTIGVWGPECPRPLAGAGGKSRRSGRQGPALRRLPARPHRRQGCHRLSHLLCRRTGVRAAHAIQRRAGGLGRAARRRADGCGDRDLCLQPTAGKVDAGTEFGPEHRIQPARGRPGAAQGQGGRFPRQGQAPGIQGPPASAGPAVHAGHDRQHRRPGRRPLSGRHPADPRPRNGREADRQPGPAVLHHLDRLWPQRRAHHHDGLSAA